MTTFTTEAADQDPIKPEAQARLAAVPVSDDVVAYTLACWKALLPRTSAEVLGAVEHQVREVFGGDEVWIGKGMAQQRKARNEQIKRDYLNGERFDLLERRYELSKRRLFQIVKG